MNDKDTSEEDLASLFQAVGPRSEPGADARQRVYAAALETWQALPDESAYRRRYPHWAIAASVLLAGVLALYLNWDAGGRIGEVAYSRGGEKAAGEPLREGEVVRTGRDETLSLRLRSGVVISLGTDAQATFHHHEQVTLDRGRAYVDAETGSVRLHTPHVRIDDIGTVYQVQADARQTLVVMREGRVELAFANRQLALGSKPGAGEFVRVDAAGEIAEQGELTTTDDAWQWHKTARAPLRLNGVSVSDYVKWLARDNGIDLRYGSAAVAQQAELETLRASAAHNSDNYNRDQALETTNFKVREVDEHTWLLDFRNR